MNTIKITENYADFSNFKGINKKLTFGMYTSGLVVYNRHIEKERTYYIPFQLDDDFISRDDYVLLILKERGVKNNSGFLLIDGVYIQDFD